MALRSPDTGPSGASRIRQPIVRTRKLVQNGTITRPSSSPRHFGFTRTASQYANGNPITRQRNVPRIEICSVFLKVWRNVPDSASP